MRRLANPVTVRGGESDVDFKKEVEGTREKSG